MMYRDEEIELDVGLEPPKHVPSTNTNKNGLSERVLSLLDFVGDGASYCSSGESSSSGQSSHDYDEESLSTYGGISNSVISESTGQNQSTSSMSYRRQLSIRSGQVDAEVASSAPALQTILDGDQGRIYITIPKECAPTEIASENNASLRGPSETTCAKIPDSQLIMKPSSSTRKYCLILSAVSVALLGGGLLAYYVVLRDGGIQGEE